jgi:hypothetical protein
MIKIFVKDKKDIPDRRPSVFGEILLVVRVETPQEFG